MVAITRTLGTQRQMRVSAEGIQSLGSVCLVSDSRQFGQQICDRHLHRQVPHTSDPEQFLRPVGVTLNAVHHQSSLHFRPDLSLTVLHWQPPPAQVAQPLLRFPAPILMRPSTQRTPTELTLRRITQPEKLVEQVETRKQRVERTVNTTTVISTQQSRQELRQSSVISTQQSRQELRQSSNGILDLPMAVVKSLPQAVQQVIAESSGAQSATRPAQPPLSVAAKTRPDMHQDHLIPPRAGQSSASELTGQTPVAIDVNRLTDQVVQAIDRRLIAYRERMGRI